MNNKIKNILVTGGAGYVGCVLVPKLLHAGFHVTVFDLFLYKTDVFKKYRSHPRFTQIKGDLRDRDTVKQCIKGIDAVIHLACLAYDFEDEVDHETARSINYDATVWLVDLAKLYKVQRFIYISSSAVYGSKKEKDVTEELTLEPLTMYAQYKVMCEEYVLKKQSDLFTVVIFRPAAVCGYSPRLRLDLSTNILTIHALLNKKMTVYGGNQGRAQIHIEDLTDVYVQSLLYPEKLIAGKIYNVGYKNYTIIKLARLVARTLDDRKVRIEILPGSDNRSFKISSDKIKKELGFIPKHTIAQAIRDLFDAWQEGKIPNALEDIRYYNKKMMEKIGKSINLN